MSFARAQQFIWKVWRTDTYSFIELCKIAICTGKNKMQFFLSLRTRPSLVSLYAEEDFKQTFSKDLLKLNFMFAK